MDIRESLNDQIYISSFNDPTVALETTQFNQTYVFEQKDQSYGDVEDELNLSPDWQPHYKHFGDLTYQSVDQIEWTLLQPTALEDIVLTPNEIINESTNLVNDFRPVSRSHYSQDLSYPDLSTIQIEVGKLTVPSWSYGQSRDSTGIAERS